MSPPIRVAMVETLRIICQPEIGIAKGAKCCSRIGPWSALRFDAFCAMKSMEPWNASIKNLNFGHMWYAWTGTLRYTSLMTLGLRSRVWSMRSASTYIAINAASLERVHASNATTGAVISAIMSGVLLGKEWSETGAPWRKIRILMKRTTCLFSARSTIRLACKTSRQAAESNCNLLCFLRSTGKTSNHE